LYRKHPNYVYPKIGLVEIFPIHQDAKGKYLMVPQTEEQAQDEEEEINIVDELEETPRIVCK
jgi:hypothetical protein